MGEKHNFAVTFGSRRLVFNGSALKTSGGLKKGDLVLNKNGRIVSRKKHLTAQKEKRLEKHGFFAKKGKFGFVKKDQKSTRKRKASSKKK